jgi:hypothetical protein
MLPCIPALHGRTLPAGLRYTRDLARGSKLAKSKARNFEPANKCAATATDFAAIHHPGGTGIARQLRKSDVILLRLQLGTERGIFLCRLAFTVVAINPGCFSHKGTRKVAKTPAKATGFSLSFAGERATISVLQTD